MYSGSSLDDWARRRGFESYYEYTKSPLYRPMKKTSKRSARSDTPSLALSISEQRKFAQELGLGEDVQNEAAKLYRNSYFQNLILGRSIKGMAAASLYAVCRDKGVPITIPELANVTGAERGKISRYYRFLRRYLATNAMCTKSRPMDELRRTKSIKPLLKVFMQKKPTTNRFLPLGGLRPPFCFFLRQTQK